MGVQLEVANLVKEHPLRANARMSLPKMNVGHVTAMQLQRNGGILTDTVIATTGTGTEETENANETRIVHLGMIKIERGTGIATATDLNEQTTTNAVRVLAIATMRRIVETRSGIMETMIGIETEIDVVTRIRLIER